jgi:serine/threonine protein kinase
VISLLVNRFVISRYLSPEVFKNKPVNRDSDIYSFGMICYHLFSGKLPLDHIQSPSEAAEAASGREELRPTWEESDKVCFNIKDGR